MTNVRRIILQLNHQCTLANSSRRRGTAWYLPWFRVRMTFEAIQESLSAEQQIRHAVLLTFCDPVPTQCSLLRRISYRDWKKLLRWLDTRGLALYFLDRMLELQRSEMLPSSVLERLQ